MLAGGVTAAALWFGFFQVARLIVAAMAL